MVRAAEKRDLARIAEIIVFGKRTAYRSIFQNDRVSFNEITVVGLYDYLTAADSRWERMLVWDDGIVKGVVGAEGTELFDFYVEPVFQGQGVGTALLDALCARARAQGSAFVEAWVIRDNWKARRFYERHGFVPTGAERPIEGTSVWDTHYRKEL